MVDYSCAVGQTRRRRPSEAAPSRPCEARVCVCRLTWSDILNNPRAFVSVNFLTLRAKVDDARPLLLVFRTLNRLLSQLSNLLAATQTRQVRASKHEVSRAVFAAWYIHERR